MKKIVMFLLIFMLMPSTISYADTSVMHTVQLGDTYYNISNSYNTNVNALITMNNKQDTHLFRGDLLKVGSLTKTITLNINGNKLHPDVNPYLENNRTFVPIRSISEALNISISWDEANRSAIIKSDTHRIVLPIGSKHADVNGSIYTLDSPVQLYQNRTFVPIRFVSEILGCNVEWDGNTYTVNINQASQTFKSTASYSADDLKWLSRIVEAEASGESFEGKLAVSNVVINRKNHYDFPNTIEGVIFDDQYGIQFTPVKNKTIFNNPSADSIAAAKSALEGTNNISTCLYFINPTKSPYSWVANNRAFYKEIENHAFHY